MLLGEDDELGLVRLEAGNVGLERLGALVGAAVIDRDADREGRLAGNASLLENAPRSGKCDKGKERNAP